MGQPGKDACSGLWFLRTRDGSDGSRYQIKGSVVALEATFQFHLIHTNSMLSELNRNYFMKSIKWTPTEDLVGHVSVALRGPALAFLVVERRV